jgi:cellobiose phosphorylase
MTSGANTSSSTRTRRCRGSTTSEQTAYFGIISNTAGGYSFYRDARLRRLTATATTPLPSTSAAATSTCATTAAASTGRSSWQPTQVPLDAYECRHGLSYTVISLELPRRGRGRRCTTSRSARALEVWRLHHHQLSRGGGRALVFSSVEFCLWDAQDDATNFQRNYSTGRGRGRDGVIYHKTEYRERRDHFAYFACSEPLAGFDTQREEFLGPYRGWDRAGRRRARRASGDSIAHGWAPHGSHHVKLALEPGETARSSSYSATGRTRTTPSSTRRGASWSTSGSSSP